MNVYQCLFFTVWVFVAIGSSWGRRRNRPRHRNGDIRLVGGTVPNEGTVLIYHRRKWAAVCDNNWDVRDADVVCKQLGYPQARTAIYGSQFGKGSMYELPLAFDDRNAKITLEIKSVNTRELSIIRFLQKQNPLNVKGQNQDENNMNGSLQNSDEGLKWMSTIACTGFEKKLKFCTFAGWGVMRRGCRSFRRSAGVICQPSITTTTSTTTTTTTTTTTKPIIATEELLTKKHEQYIRDREDRRQENLLSLPQGDAPATMGLQIRMVGGRYDWEGRLEVKDDHDEWGAICGQNWTLREAMVACRELGHDYGKQALQVNYFGGEHLNKHYHQIKCKGRENRLDECEKIRRSTGIWCPKVELVAGIVCTDRLPDLIPDLEMLAESVSLRDRPLYYLRCSMEENCLSSSAYVVRNTSKNWASHNRRLLRFSTVVHNIGLEDFRPYRAKAQWEWHACHMHYHSMEVFAHYDIVDQHGNRLAEGSKASFCLEDSECQDGVVPKFDCTGYRDQGLSVNCSDNYLYDIDCQWIDITDIKPHHNYTFKMEVNPRLLVAEMDFDNNVASCQLWYSGYNARLQNCVFESLLSD